MLFGVSTDLLEIKLGWHESWIFITAFSPFSFDGLKKRMGFHQFNEWFPRDLLIFCNKFTLLVKLRLKFSSETLGHVTDLNWPISLFSREREGFSVTQKVESNKISLVDLDSCYNCNRVSGPFITSAPSYDKLLFFFTSLLLDLTSYIPTRRS